MMKHRLKVPGIKQRAETLAAATDRSLPTVHA